MSQERMRILDLLSQGKITATEADALIRSLDAAPKSSEDAPQRRALPKFLMIQVLSRHPSKGDEKVNVRVPFQLLKSGMKLASLLPTNVRGEVTTALGEKGIDFDFSKVKPENLEEIMNEIADLSVDVDNENEKVRIYCE